MNLDYDVNKAFFNTRESAQYLGLSNRTLEKYRMTGEGPLYYKIGRKCLYKIADLENWVTGSLRKSTLSKA